MEATKQRARLNDALTAERARELLAYDAEAGVLVWRVNRPRGVKSGDVAGWDHRANCHSGLTYRLVGVDGVDYRAHRVVMLMHTGAWPVDEIQEYRGSVL